jgi:MFS family permease
VGTWSNSVPTGLGMLCGFAIGSITDRFKGVRLIAPTYLIFGFLSYLSFYFVHDKWTFLYFSILSNLVNFVLGIVVAAFTIEVFPREKLGQFCSAQAIFYQFAINMSSPFAAMLFDHIHNNRLSFIWKGAFFILAGLAYFKVQLNWCKRHGEPPVPRAG